MKKCQIVLALFLPADKKAAGAIEPGMGSLYHPPPGTMTRDEKLFLLLLPATTDMRDVLMGLDLVPTIRIVIASIQAEMVRLLRRGIRPSNDDAVQGSAQQC